MATIVQISALTAMEGFNAVEMARVLGWDCVVKVGDFAVGDLAIYCEVGYCLPNEGNTAFLGGLRLKNRKFKKFLSQGLVCPLGWISTDKTLSVGDCVADLMRIVKWIPSEEENLYVADGKNRNPDWFPKTDEERGQNCLGRLKNHLGSNLVITQKYDGTSVSFCWDGGRFIVCGRNFVQITGTESVVYLEMAARYGLERKLTDMGRVLAIQCELIGPKINNNRHKLTKTECYAFNIYDGSCMCYLPWREVIEICGALGLNTVPVVYEGPVTEEYLSIDKMRALSNSQMYAGGLVAEGIVMKTTGADRFSCKVISSRYEEKHGL